MSMIYHPGDGVHQDTLIAGAYAEHVGTLGFDEQLSSISRNAVENRVITARILQDETNYLPKTEAATAYVAKADFATELNTAIQAYYPVGTIYMNDVATSVPFDFGTWSLIDDKFLYGCTSDFSDIGNTGGISTVTLSTSHFPTGNIPVNFPAVTGTTGYTDLNHRHWGRTGDMVNTDGSSTTNYANIGGLVKVLWSSAYGQGRLSLNGIAGKYGTGSEGNTAHNGFNINLSHAHEFWTSGSKNLTDSNDKDLNHSHSIEIPAQVLNVQINSGTQDSFSIVPPYKKVAIWHRTA